MKRGFTLIELLITIAIVGVLSTFGLITYQGISGRARDNVRKTDIRNLAVALEIYYQQNRQYIGTAQADGSCATSFDEFYNRIAPKINGPVPTDPKEPNPRYLYTAEKKCQSFRLFAKLEDCNDLEIIPGVACDGIAYPDREQNYSVTSDDLFIAAAPTGGSTGEDTPQPHTPPLPPPPSSTIPASTAYKRVFVTTTASYTGNLGGLNGADQKCVDEANTSSARLCGSADCPTGSWKAWLSTGTINARDRLTDSEYRRLDGTIIANDKVDLTNGNIANPINIQPDGTSLSGFNGVWTGTNGSGLLSIGHCNNWTINDSSNTGWGSTERTNNSWTDIGTTSCSSSHRLYCFEQ